MRTKNAKRIWPVPVTLGVMALAALLAFGLLATTGAQPAAAQSADPCVKVAADTDTAAADAQASTHVPTTLSMNGKENPTDGCDSSSSEAIIELAGPRNTGSSARANYVIYGTDVEGSSSSVYPAGTMFGDHDADMSTSNAFYTGTAGRDAEGELMSQEVFALAAVAIGVGPAMVNTSGAVTPSKETITLSGAPLTTGFVYVLQGSGFTGPIDGDGDLTTPKTGGADSVRLIESRALSLEIIFLGPPVATAPDDTAEDETDLNREPRSVLTITTGDKTISATDTEDIVVTAAVKDAMDRDLKGKITYTVEFVEGSALAPGQQHSYTTRQMDYDATPIGIDDDKGTTHPINGWATGTNPVRINVSATFTGGTGTIILPLVQVEASTDEIDEIVINRAGKLDRVEIVASCYAPSADDEERVATKAEAKICGKGVDPDKTDASMVEMRPRTVFRAGQTFTLKANAVDTLGTDTRRTISLDLPDVSTVDGADAFSAGASLDKVDDVDDKIVISIHEDAPPGKYDLTVKASEGSGSDRIEQEATIAIVVSGDPETYTVTGPANIALTSFASGEYTVKAVDAQGNPPNFDDDEDMVSVVVESDLDVRVTGLDTTGKVMLDEETGEATFSVFKPASAMHGDTVSIGIFVGDELQDEATVAFGEPSMVPGMPMNVMAEATSDTEITVSWESPAADGGSAVTGYVLQRKTGMMDFMTIAASSAEVWWNTLDCPMMNAEIPDDATPAPPADDTDMTSPYCAMYAGLSAEATTVVDGVFADEYDTISGTSYSDMGLMAETTYYYRVSAINSAGKGEYSDGMAMATTMMATTMIDELGTVTDVITGFNRGGALQVSWTKAANASGYIIIAINVNDVNNDVVAVVLNDGDLDTRNISGLTPGATYDIYVAATASGGRNSLSDAARVTAK